MDSIKSFLIDVGIKQLGPSAIRGGILGLFGWLLAKQNALAAFGIIADQATHTITIHLDQLNLSIVALLPAIMAALIKLGNHQANATVKAIVTPPSNNVG